MGTRGNYLHCIGYKHDKVLYSYKVYVMGNVHTNTVESFWSLCKNGTRGIFHSISPKYFQYYLNEYTFRYHHRDDESPMFKIFLRRMFSPHQA